MFLTSCILTTENKLWANETSRVSLRKNVQFKTTNSKKSLGVNVKSCFKRFKYLSLYFHVVSCWFELWGKKSKEIKKLTTNCFCWFNTLWHLSPLGRRTVKPPWLRSWSRAWLYSHCKNTSGSRRFSSWEKKTVSRNQKVTEVNRKSPNRDPFSVNLCGAARPPPSASCAKAKHLIQD